MSTFGVLLLCIQACLVQNVFGQCANRAGFIPAAPIASSGCGGILSPASSISYAPSSAIFSPAAAAFSPAFAIDSAATAIGSAGYGGIGEGNVVVSGELPVSGSTALAGQVPIIGIVSFGGAVPAAGAVSINGQCSCGCQSAYVY